jgi:branched-chain amino acid transport system substrate-binding protein
MLRRAFEDFGGSVLGKPIELLVADHQNKVDVWPRRCAAMVWRAG